MKKFEINAKTIKEFITNNLIAILLVVLCIFVGVTRDNFFSWANVSNIASNVTPRFIIALGISGILITTGTDLSAGRAIGLAAVLSCSFLQTPGNANNLFPNLPAINMWIVLIGVILVTTLFSLLDGIIVSVFHVPPFLATLGMQTIIYGIACVYTGAQPLGGLRSDYTAVTTSPLIKLGSFNFKWLFLFAIGAGALFWFLYNKTRYGKYMYAIGGNENAAEVSGVNVTKSKIKIYALAGAMYGLAGFLLASKSGGASVNMGLGYETEAIAACTIGGVSITGGVGKVSGILLGVLVFELLKTSMQFLGINSFYQQIIQGIVIIVAVAFDIRKYIAKK